MRKSTVIRVKLWNRKFSTSMSFNRKFSAFSPIWHNKKKHMHKSTCTEHDFDSNVYYLIPFYVMYTAFVPLHAKFAVTIYRIGQRYRSLNGIISTFAATGKFITSTELIRCFSVWFPETVSVYPFSMNFDLFLSVTVQKHGYFRSDYKQSDDVVHRFMRIYDSLGKALNCESE